MTGVICIRGFFGRSVGLQKFLKNWETRFKLAMGPVIYFCSSRTCFLKASLILVTRVWYGKGSGVFFSTLGRSWEMTVQTENGLPGIYTECKNFLSRFEIYDLMQFSKAQFKRLVKCKILELNREILLEKAKSKEYKKIDINESSLNLILEILLLVMLD